MHTVLTLYTPSETLRELSSLSVHQSSFSVMETFVWVLRTTRILRFSGGIFDKRETFLVFVNFSEVYFHRFINRTFDISRRRAEIYCKFPDRILCYCRLCQQNFLGKFCIMEIPGIPIQRFSLKRPQNFPAQNYSIWLQISFQRRASTRFAPDIYTTTTYFNPWWKFSCKYSSTQHVVFHGNNAGNSSLRRTHSLSDSFVYGCRNKSSIPIINHLALPQENKGGRAEKLQASACFWKFLWLMSKSPNNYQPQDIN